MSSNSSFQKSRFLQFLSLLILRLAQMAQLIGYSVNSWKLSKYFRYCARENRVQNSNPASSFYFLSHRQIQLLASKRCFRRQGTLILRLFLNKTNMILLLCSKFDLNSSKHKSMVQKSKEIYIHNHMVSEAAIINLEEMELNDESCKANEKIKLIGEQTETSLL